jgi:hypothetical protein
MTGQLTPLPPIQPTMLPPIEPVRQGAQPPQLAMGYGTQLPYPPYGAYPAYTPYPVYVPVPAADRSAPPQIVYVNPPPGEPREIHVYGAALPSSDRPEKLAMAAPAPARQSTPSFETPKRPAGLDRLSLTSWATMRNESGPDSLASGGMLGGSEAGVRLMWRFTPKLAAYLPPSTASAAPRRHLASATSHSAGGPSP